MQQNLLALLESVQADKQMFELLKVETVEALEILRKESETFARKITDTGERCC